MFLEQIVGAHNECGQNQEDHDGDNSISRTEQKVELRKMMLKKERLKRFSFELKRLEAKFSFI